MFRIGSYCFAYIFLVLFFCFNKLIGSIKEEKFISNFNKNKSGKIYELSIRSKYLDFIINGSKTIEIRVGVPKLKNIEKNDLMYFYDELNRCSFCKVVYIRKYRSFDELLAMEGLTNSIPEIAVGNKSGCELISEGLEMIDSLPDYKEKVKIYGALAIKLSYLNFFTTRPPKLISVNGE